MRRVALLLALFASPVAAQTMAPDLTPALRSWLAGQSNPDTALEAIVALMNDVDQSDGIRPERLEADIKVMIGDIVSETTERVMRTDVDDDGIVSFAEFDAMNPRLNDDTLRLTFAPYDPDADGRTDREAISAGERASVIARLEASPLYDVAYWDADGDGIVRVPEIGAVLAGLPMTVWAEK